MEVEFIGVGEAFDCNNSNTSIFVKSDTKLLIDCGFTVFHAFSKCYNDADYLDAVYISHFHGDHVGSLPALLLWLWEEGRTRDLNIVCQEDSEKKIMDLLDLVYPNFKEKFNYDIKFVIVGEGDKIRFNELSLSFAFTVHSTNNLAIKVEEDGESVCYSGDGMFNEKTLEMYKGSSLVIQEAYLFDEEKIGHASIMSSVEKIDARKIALVHINRHFRREKWSVVKSFFKKSKKDVIVPVSGDVVSLKSGEDLDE